jgi:hypothetical protein
MVLPVKVVMIIGALRFQIPLASSTVSYQSIEGSTEFATRWARHNVRFHRSARKTLRNPLVGDIELTGDSLELPGEGLILIAYTTEPGSHAQEQLDFLASWNTTQQAPAGSTSIDHAQRKDQPN